MVYCNQRLELALTSQNSKRNYSYDQEQVGFDNVDSVPVSKIKISTGVYY